MSDWPDGMTVAPIREWPGVLTARRQRSNFSAPWSATLSLLRAELRSLRAREVELLVAIPADQFRLDGKPRATAKQEHPGVILSFESSVGHLSYAVDTFTHWMDNVRGIAKALEALRMVDRYGVTKHGEQYRGFLAIEATTTPAGFASREEAYAFVTDLAGSVVSDAHLMTVDSRLRYAKRAAHPDTGGDAATFQRVSLAEAKLREEGVLR